jgi:lipopolysaccharide export system permease protein
MRTLDRYVLRNFLEPFVLCFLGFLGIQFVFDLNDNLSDFAGGKTKWGLIGLYYLHQLPHFILLALPLGLLLALLYSLSKMSRSNEIISMLTAGRSVVRVLAPLFVCGVLATVLCGWLNYEVAPRADATRKADLEKVVEASKGNKEKDDEGGVIKSLLALDRMTNRIWFVRKFPLKQNQLSDVYIAQLDDRGEPVSRWHAQAAHYDPKPQTWALVLGRKLNYDADGNVAGEMERWDDQVDPKRVARSMAGWKENPWRLRSSTMVPDQMTVPELTEYLHYNADFPPIQLAPYITNWHHRWAFPFTCLSVVFIAAPLGIVFSRRAVLASVAGSIFIFFGYLFLMFFFFALGKGGHISPLLAGWIPGTTMFLIGVYLLFLRATNREFPKLFSRG